MIDVSVDQALAFRVAGHHLDRRVGADEAVAAFGLQEYPPEWGALAALRARSDEPMPGDVVQVNAFRGSPYVVRRADARIFTRALVPEDEAGLKALVGSASAKEVIEEGFTVREALDRVAAAAREGLADGPLDRDAFHQAMRERLPDGLLPWCRGCQSHHVRPGFWRALGPLEVTEMPEKATWGLADPPEMPLEEARAELVRRFLRVYGPATHSQLASLAQTAASHAKRLFEAIADELEPAAVDGRKGFVLAEDAGAAGVAAGGAGRAPARRPRPLRRPARPRGARARRRGAEAAVPLGRAPGRRARRRRPRRPVARLQEGRRARGRRRVARRRRSTSPRRRRRSRGSAGAQPPAWPPRTPA